MNFNLNIVFNRNSYLAAVVGMKRGENLVLTSAVNMNSYNTAALKILKINRCAFQLEAL